MERQGGGGERVRPLLSLRMGCARPNLSKIVLDANEKVCSTV